MHSGNCTFGCFFLEIKLSEASQNIPQRWHRKKFVLFSSIFRTKIWSNYYKYGHCRTKNMWPYSWLRTFGKTVGTFLQILWYAILERYAWNFGIGQIHSAILATKKDVECSQNYEIAQKLLAHFSLVWPLESVLWAILTYE